MARVQVRLISMDIDGVDRADEVSKFEIHSNPTSADFQTFEDARNGGKRDYTAVITLVQDHASATLWTKTYTGGGTDVPVVYAPYGNEVATVAEPHYEGTVTIKEPDGLLMGGEADPSPTAVGTIEVVWPFLAKPVPVTA